MKKRRPWIAALFSILSIGLGHVYAGNLLKGLILLATPFLVLGLGGLVLDFSVPVIFYGMLLFFVLLFLYALVSAFLLARRNKHYHLKKFNAWYVYLFIYIVGAIASTTFTSHRAKITGFETYSIPSMSMNPTLQVGDFITASTRNVNPEVGDVVIFPYPRDPSIVYVFRVVAAGGDVVSIDKGIVTRNGEVENYPFPIEDEASFIRQKSLEETTIPQGELFVLGDNRSRSNDSRYWGTVKTSDVIAQARYIWFSKNKARIGTKIH